MEYLKDKINFFSAEYFLQQYPFKINKMTQCHQFMHYHDYIQMWYVKNGNCSHWINDVEYHLKKGDVIILPPHLPHRLDSQSCQNLVIIGCEFLENLIYDHQNNINDCLKPILTQSDDLTPVYSLSGNYVKIVEGLFEEMLMEYVQQKSCFDLQIKANILKILSILVRGSSNINDSHKKNLVYIHQNVIAKAIDYIDINYRKKITLAEVCKITMMSSTYFAYIFKEVTGRTFTEYINYLRIQNAVELLSDYSLSIKEIGKQMGFNDPAYFARTFKKHMGISPGKYRSML